MPMIPKTKPLSYARNHFDVSFTFENDIVDDCVDTIVSKKKLLKI